MERIKISQIIIKGFENISLGSELKRLSDKHSLGYSETDISEILDFKAEVDTEKLSTLLKFLTSDHTDSAIEVMTMNLSSFEKLNYFFLNGKCHILHY
jgi:hypothetical protein|uniref:Uncharacterized protein n=1 Tax=Myoviridae sp. ctuim2 TaxID=2827717 RepID=A0A8S5SD10_9CAUD|nr:MAG TPA: hypothetical protein [Myoviridae sp. ctuim2]